MPRIAAAKGRAGAGVGHGVFIHRADSIYDDSPAEQYQFPAMYLDRVRACAGDWIVYYEPRKVAFTRGYFAVARVAQVIPDPKTAGMFLAIIEPGSYLDLPSPVPFAGPDGRVERGVRNPQWAVRPLADADFERILALGLGDEAPLLPRVGLADEQTPFVLEMPRDRVLTSRAVRDRSFRRLVLQAYDRRCAFTGLQLINGGGRAEVEAAHIRPVEANGPDGVNNGLALCGTAHWMFDRGLISLDDDLRFLVSRKVNDQEGVRALLNRDGRARQPPRASDRPHPHFLAWHREHRFAA